MIKLDRLDRITLKALPVIIVLVVLAWVIFSLANQVRPTQRGNFHNISKVEIKHPYSNATAVYNSEDHTKIVRAIVNDINSQSYGPWRQSLGSKEGASVVSITLYRTNGTDDSEEEVAASFSLYRKSLMERAESYRQLSAQGMIRRINIKKLPALQNIWCDSRYTKDDNLSSSQHYSDC